MEEQALTGVTVGKGHVQRGWRMDRLHVGAQRPANDLPVVPVYHDHQIHLACARTQVRDVGHPFLPTLFGMKLAVQQIGTDGQFVVRMGRQNELPPPADV
jgi:hypothetical protein